MDTKYWGPSGWKLLHQITFAYPNPTRSEKECLQMFFAALPFVLPCKYCRASLSEYMVARPLEKALESSTPYALAKWLYDIHNDVNAKLRGQRLYVEANPPFSEVKKVYLERLGLGCTKTHFEGWEFLFSVVENHPYSKQSLGGKAVKGAPESADGLSTLEKNRWNMLKPDERMVVVEQFWRSLPNVFPFPEWKRIWESCSEFDWTTRATSLKTLWRIRCKMEAELKLLNSTDFSSLCKELRTYRSGCNKSKRAITCRKSRGLSSAAQRKAKKDTTR